MKNKRAEALLVLDVPVPIIHQKRIAELAATYRLPTMFLGGRRMSEAGGLVAYRIRCREYPCMWKGS